MEQAVPPSTGFPEITGAQALRRLPCTAPAYGTIRTKARLWPDFPKRQPDNHPYARHYLAQQYWVEATFFAVDFLADVLFGALFTRRQPVFIADLGGATAFLPSCAPLPSVLLPGSTAGSAFSAQGALLGSWSFGLFGRRLRRDLRRTEPRRAASAPGSTSGASARSLRACCSREISLSRA